MHIEKLAAEWRCKMDYTGKGGVVVIFGGEVSGWVNELRDPKHWEPGCIAIDEEGNQWEAQGGDPYHGAKHWEPIGKSEAGEQWRYNRWERPKERHADPEGNVWYFVGQTFKRPTLRDWRWVAGQRIGIWMPTGLKRPELPDAVSCASH